MAMLKTSEVIKRLESLAETFERHAREEAAKGTPVPSLSSAAEAYRHAAAIARGPLAEAEFNERRYQSLVGSR